MTKVFITGGSGLLGSNLIKELKKNNILYIAPSSNECDICDYNTLEKTILEANPSVLIHSAAISKFIEVEKNPIQGLDVNIIGTTNIVKVCMKYNIRMIFISTSHVFDGKQGMYKTTDCINPLTKYSKTKAAGEYITSTLNNYLIIRTEFCGLDFPFDTAYVDKWSSKDYIDKLAPLILNQCLSNKIGICHLAGTRKSFYELGLERNPHIKPGSVKEIQSISKIPILIDTSLELS